MLAADGSVNFPGVTWEFRPGSVDQEHIAGVPAVENELAVGVELKSDAPWVRAVNNTQLSAVRLRLSWPAIQRQQENGDVVGYRIDYAIDIAVDGGAWQEALKASLDDKSTSRYERSHRVDLPEARSGWQVRVRRLTPNQNNNRVADTMRVEAITEVIDAKLRYPNTALLFVEFDASQFQSIPQISVEARGRRVRVPSNYDPQTRSYSGTWDGSFKSAWTSNPAWHWYDIVLHKRFGLGRRIDASMVDKWSLYRIAQYCDQSVPDGKGGQEPRFSCNLYLQSRAEAWTVLRDLAAIFRGMSYWSGAEMVAVSDMPEDEAYTFSPSNTVRGDDGSHFNYSSSRQRDRHTLALVNYDNPGNGYQSQPVAVNNDRAQRRYGISQLEITAIGCTSEGEAQRRGQWALLTEELEQDAVTFRTGMDGRGLAPGKIIAVADPVKSGKQIGGRLSAVDGRALTLDRDVEARPGDRLLVNLPNGKAEARSVQSVVGRVLTVTAAYSETPRPQGQWALQSNSLTTQRFRIMSITRYGGQSFRDHRAATQREQVRRHRQRCAHRAAAGHQHSAGRAGAAAERADQGFHQGRPGVGGDQPVGLLGCRAERGGLRGRMAQGLGQLGAGAANLGARFRRAGHLCRSLSGAGTRLERDGGRLGLRQQCGDRS